jgi:hypothetical protein
VVVVVGVVVFVRGEVVLVRDVKDVKDMAGEGEGELAGRKNIQYRQQLQLCSTFDFGMNQKFFLLRQGTLVQLSSLISMPLLMVVPAHQGLFVFVSTSRKLL